MTDAQIREKIHKELITSGEYERISAYLRQSLIASGWYNRVEELATENLRSQENPSFNKLIGDVEHKALEIVPENVKLEALNMIKAFLDKVVDT
ncbi:transcription factor e(y)2-domain-containing protein [Limtongia smithiae]|uniref:transcription factor e(y)2-domain-containing protein n=1 Tax=Limtongia smithiae TaxID=1125753 RepID=UPI0034CD0338